MEDLDPNDVKCQRLAANFEFRQLCVQKIDPGCSNTTKLSSLGKMKS